MGQLESIAPLQPVSRILPLKGDTRAWWEGEEGQEYLQQHFSLKHIAKYFRTRSPVSAADIDGWRARELVAPLFMGDDEELQELIRTHLILPYLFGDFHPSHIQEYAGGLLLALEKPVNEDGSPGGLRPIICGETWRRCFANLAAAAVRGPISKIFTSTYENFLQTAGLQDGASHCAKILSAMYSALNSDLSDPEVIIKLDISNAFNVLCRRLTLDVLGGKASCDYACGLKAGDNLETVCEELRNMFEYFKAMRTTTSHLRYFDFCGNVLDAWGKTGGQQGDPLEMITFCLTIHHLWGRTLDKHNQDACAVAYADDGYIKAKLSVALEVLSDIKLVLKGSETPKHKFTNCVGAVSKVISLVDPEPCGERRAPPKPKRGLTAKIPDKGSAEYSAILLKKLPHFMRGEAPSPSQA